MSNPLGKIGCNAKLPFNVLSEIVPANGNSTLEKTWSDFTAISDTCAYSIDTVGLLSSKHLELSAISALNHCMNDIISGGYAPTHVGVSVSINPDEFSISALKEIMGTLDKACKLNGSQLGKSHSVYGLDNFISFVTIGETRIVPSPVAPNKTYDLILTKKLGGFRSFVLNLNSKQDQALESEAADSMLTSHLTMLNALNSLSEPTSDVSGNGLLGTLHLVSRKHDLSISISSEDVQIIGQEFGDTPVSCGSKNNKEAFNKFIHMRVRLDGDLEEALYAPEYSGPMLFLVDSSESSETLSLLHDSGLKHAHKIGVATQGHSEVEVV